MISLKPREGCPLDCSDQGRDRRWVSREGPWLHCGASLPVKEAFEFPQTEGLAGSGAEAEGWVLLQGTGVCRPGALQSSRVTRARRGARGCACPGKGAECPAPGVSSVRKEGVRDRVEVINQAHGGQTRARKQAPWAHSPG